jgi:hypothetical protein
VLDRVKFTKSTALLLCELNEAGYQLATTGHCTLPTGFSPPVAIRMAAETAETPRPFLLRTDPLDIWGFAATGPDEKLYLVFRGTQITSGMDFAQEWALDALSLPLAKFRAGSVHLGFYRAWMALRTATDEKISAIAQADIVVTGHSLGAAIATLCWAEFGGDLMTFASPRVGDPDFAKALWDGQTARVFNGPDIVPDVPTDPPFRHGGYPQCVDGTGSFLDWKAAHSLPAYIAGIEKLP